MHYGAVERYFSYEGAYKLLEIIAFICPKVKNGGVFFMFKAYLCLKEKI